MLEGKLEEKKCDNWSPALSLQLSTSAQISPFVRLDNPVAPEN